MALSVAPTSSALADTAVADLARPFAQHVELALSVLPRNFIATIEQKKVELPIAHNGHVAASSLRNMPTMAYALRNGVHQGNLSVSKDDDRNGRCEVVYRTHGFEGELLRMKVDIGHAGLRVGRISMEKHVDAPNGPRWGEPVVVEFDAPRSDSKLKALDLSKVTLPQALQPSDDVQQQAFDLFCRARDTIVADLSGAPRPLPAMTEDQVRSALQADGLGREQKQALAQAIDRALVDFTRPLELDLSSENVDLVCQALGKLPSSLRDSVAFDASYRALRNPMCLVLGPQVVDRFIAYPASEGDAVTIGKLCDKHEPWKPSANEGQPALRAFLEQADQMSDGSKAASFLALTYVLDKVAPRGPVLGGPNRGEPVSVLDVQSGTSHSFNAASDRKPVLDAVYSRLGSLPTDYRTPIANRLMAIHGPAPAIEVNRLMSELRLSTP